MPADPASRPAARPASLPGRLPPAPRRAVVDHGLARRALLRELAAGGLLTGATRVSPDEVCDAAPELLRAAEASGTPVDRGCPVCGRPLAEVSWVFGESLGVLSGTPRTPVQLAALAVRRAEFAVYDVEVCRGCRWNALLRTWRTGRAPAPAG